jgi:hypothetical protein
MMAVTWDRTMVAWSVGTKADKTADSMVVSMAGLLADM